MALRLFIILGLAALISACGPVYETYYTYQAPQSTQAKQCIITCQQAKTTCNSACSTEQFQCQQEARSRARFNFSEYKSQRRLEGKPVNADLNDFYNGDSCFNDCGKCKVQFNNCYTMCGGEVLVHKRCVAFCGKESS